MDIVSHHWLESFAFKTLVLSKVIGTSALDRDCSLNLSGAYKCQSMEVRRIIKNTRLSLSFVQ